MRSNAADRPEMVVRTKSHRLVHLRGQGKISYVGSSNFAAWDVALTNFTGVRCVSCAVRRRWHRPWRGPCQGRWLSSRRVVTGPLQ